MFNIAKTTSNFIINIIILFGYTPCIGIEIITIEIGIDDTHNLCPTLITQGRLIKQAIKTVDHLLMGNDIIEFLDVAVGCINWLGNMSLPIIHDKTNSIVEVGDMGFIFILARLIIARLIAGLISKLIA